METGDIYIAVIIYKSTSVSGDKQPLYEESFVLLRATDEAEARSKALAHARNACVSYDNVEGETIRWSLQRVLEVKPVLQDELQDGAELYARYFRDWDAYQRFEPLLGGSLD
jgi:hypothetical protein